MKYISLRTLIEHGKELRFQSAEQMKAVYERMPSIEIVRCKDCIYWTNNIGNYLLRDNYCNHDMHGFFYHCKEDDYCSYAERRADDDDA